MHISVPVVAPDEAGRRADVLAMIVDELDIPRGIDILEIDDLVSVRFLIGSPFDEVAAAKAFAPCVNVLLRVERAVAVPLGQLRLRERLVHHSVHLELCHDKMLL